MRRTSGRAQPSFVQTAERVGRITRKLAASPQGREYRDALRVLRTQNRWTPVYRVRGAEGDYEVLTSSRGDLVERYRAAARAAELEARRLGALPGDWYALAMRLEKEANS